MHKISPQFEAFYKQIAAEIGFVEGFLGPLEIRFLAVLAAIPTARGEILEIGSFKGKSTIVLAKAAELTELKIIHAVDPMTGPSDTDPDLEEGEDSLAHFRNNIADHGVSETVVLHQMTSEELAKTWNKPIRLLWIDGDHTYKGAKLDFDGFRPHLADGAIVAIHDVLHEFEGGLRVFAEDILLSPHFGASGVVGSIGWAQFHSDKKGAASFRKEKLDLYKRLSRLVPYVALGNNPKGLEKKKYKIFRSRVPRGHITPGEWISSVTDKLQMHE